MVSLKARNVSTATLRQFIITMIARIFFFFHFRLCKNYTYSLAKIDKLCKEGLWTHFAKGSLSQNPEEIKLVRRCLFTALLGDVCNVKLGDHRIRKRVLQALCFVLFTFFTFGFRGCNSARVDYRLMIAIFFCCRRFVSRAGTSFMLNWKTNINS